MTPSFKVLAAIETPSAHFFKVNYDGQPSVVKSFKAGFEKDLRRSTWTLERFGGRGMVKLLGQSGNKQILEYLEGETLLKYFHFHGDAAAAQVFCEVLQKLHSTELFTHQTEDPPPAQMKLPNLNTLFSPLFADHPLWVSDEELWRDIERTAIKLLSTEENPRILHGDLHHENIVHSKERGWLALDPKGVRGEFTYELANFYYNPTQNLEVQSSVDRIRALTKLFSETFNIDEKRILQFVLVHGGVSGLWAFEDGEDPRARLYVANQVRQLIR